MAQSHKTTPPVVKIKPATHAALQEISREEDRPMGEIITELVDRYERERFWRAASADLERLRREDDALQDTRVESQEGLDHLANDGLESEPPFFTPGEEDEIRAEIDAETKSG